MFQVQMLVSTLASFAHNHLDVHNIGAGLHTRLHQWPSPLASVHIPSLSSPCLVQSTVPVPALSCGCRWVLTWPDELFILLWEEAPGRERETGEWCVELVVASWGLEMSTSKIFRRDKLCWVATVGLATRRSHNFKRQVSLKSTPWSRGCFCVDSAS